MFSFASAGKSAAYLTVSEAFPLEVGERGNALLPVAGPGAVWW